MLAKPPPSLTAVFPESVAPVRVKLPSLKMPPPYVDAELPVSVHSLRIA